MNRSTYKGTNFHVPLNTIFADPLSPLIDIVFLEN